MTPHVESSKMAGHFFFQSVTVILFIPDQVDNMSFKGKPIQGVLLDITGVLLEDGKAIQGSVEAVQRLKSAGIDVRFVTNETQLTRKKLVEKLHGQNFTMPEEAM